MALNLLNEQIEIVTDEPTLTIFLIESQDCKNDLTIDGVEFSELENLYGDLAENSLYLINNEKRSYVFKVDLKKLEYRNMLDCHSPGKSHFDMLVGSSLTSQLVAEKYFRSEDVIKLEASETLKASLTFGQHFIAGLRIKSVTNKLGESSESKESSCSKAKDFKRKIHLKNLCSQKALEQANALVQSLIVTKSLVNAPANILNPESYEHFSLEYMERLKSLGYPVEVEIFDKSKLQNDGAGLILAVGAASQHSPRIIKLVYSPPKPEKKFVLLAKVLPTIPAD